MDDPVRLAVFEALGVPHLAAVPSPEDAAAGVVDKLTAAHERDLAHGEADLSERLAARMGPDVLHDPRALIAIDHVMTADRGAHEYARGVVHRDLVEAFAAPADERDQRVSKVLDAERQRVSVRGRTRAARATQRLLAALRLPDAALDAPLGAAG